jgi:hypothetical protein
LIEVHLPRDQRVNGPITPDTDVLTRAPRRAVLAAEYAPRLGNLASKELDTQHLGIRVTAISTRTLSLFMSHETIVLKHAFQGWRGARQKQNPEEANEKPRYPLRSSPISCKQRG